MSAMTLRQTGARGLALEVLLAAGIAAPLVYGAADLIAGWQWQGYRFRDQTISELGAIGAPSSQLFSALLVVVYALVLVFGFGVWSAAAENRRLRVVGGLLMSLGGLSLVAGPFASMHQRAAETSFSDTVHLGVVALGASLIVAAMAVGAGALGARFRLYSVATIVVMLAFGAWSATAAADVAASFPTPWLGVKERLSVYAYQAWFIVLAIALIRQHVAERARASSPAPCARLPNEAALQRVKDAATEFLTHRRIAVTGVSRHPESHGANVVYQRLRARGYEVFPVNPNATEVEGAECFHDLRSITGGVDAVVIGTRAALAVSTMRECEALGIKYVWMHRAFGPGSVSDVATAYGREHGIHVIDGGCPLMFDPVADPAHKTMRWVLTLTGKVPQRC